MAGWTAGQAPAPAETPVIGPALNPEHHAAAGPAISSREVAIGTALVAVSAMGFGFMGFFRGLATGEAGGHCSTETLLVLRFAIATGVLWLVVLARRLPVPMGAGGRTLAALVAMGAVGYVGEAMCYYKALEYIPSGLVALLLYLYPGIVAVVSAAIGLDRLTPTRVAAVAVALGGSVLTVLPLLHAGVGGGEHAGGVGLGIALGVGSAGVYAAYIIAGTWVMRGVEPIAATAVVTSAAAAVFGVIAMASGWRPPTTATGWTGVVALALVSTVVSVLAFLAGLARVGPVRASTISTLEALTTVIVGAALMGEGVHTVQVVGGGLILLAAIVVARAKPRKT